MGTEGAREAAAASLRALSHAFAAHELADDALASLADTANELARRVDQSPKRDRLALMQNRPEGQAFGGDGFEDRAVGGSANPTSVEVMSVRLEADVVADVELRRAFEGAPGRAHGGIVAAIFDDVTGFVIGKLQEPAFTGELTVRYLAPVPVDERLEIRARLDGRERRKLFISAEMRAGEKVVATCRAIYVTVDPSRFAGAPDPR
ncbi:MAG TPA: PaaI family thioesterase [Acidimicrobiales bacterium]|nr:PaaI family thioesterase [Acidimicrobiales bacterium]